MPSGLSPPPRHPPAFPFYLSLPFPCLLAAIYCLLVPLFPCLLSTVYCLLIFLPPPPHRLHIRLRVHARGLIARDRAHDEGQHFIAHRGVPLLVDLDSAFPDRPLAGQELPEKLLV